MYKKFFMGIAAMAALTLVSCSSDDLNSLSDNSSKNEAISFDGYLGRSAVAVNGSRGSELNLPALKGKNGGFGVFGNYSSTAEGTPAYGNSLFKNQQVTYDKTKLGDVQNLIFKIIELQQSLVNPKTPISEILNEKIYEGFNFKELFDLIELLKSISGNTLKEYIETIFNYYEESEIKGYKQKVEDVFKEIDTYSLENLVSFMLEKLYRDIDDEQLEDAKTKIETLLSIPIIEYIKWYEFVNRVEKQDVIYHTYHATKGLEFDNVLIIMENKFGQERNKFSEYFTNPQNSAENTKNLLYVACSRARKNLRIFYLDDVTNFNDGIESIFGSVLNYNI